MDNLGAAVSEYSTAAAQRRENLALFYQGILTAVVRVQSGRQSIGDGAAFRQGMQAVLDQVGREAARSGYETQDVADSNYAVVAFLDEAVLDSNDPGRTHWRSMQVDLYEKAVAGDFFYERLSALVKRRDSLPLSDVLEVYQLCLLLGYRGKYSGPSGEADIKRWTDQLGPRITQIRGSSDQISIGTISQRVQAASFMPQSQRPAWLLPALLLVVGISAWMVFRILLYLQGSAIRDSFMKAGQ